MSQDLTGVSSTKTLVDQVVFTVTELDDDVFLITADAVGLGIAVRFSSHTLMGTSKVVEGLNTKELALSASFALMEGVTRGGVGVVTEQGMRGVLEIKKSAAPEPETKEEPKPEEKEEEEDKEEKPEEEVAEEEKEKDSS